MKFEISPKGKLFQVAARLFYQHGYRAIGVDTIVSEHRALIIRAEALEQADRRRIKEMLGEPFEIRRREVRLPLGPEQAWRSMLLRALEVLREVIRT